MTNYRTLIGATLLALTAAPAFAQQGAPGGSLYQDPQSRSYVQSADKAKAEAAKAPAPSGAASSDANTQPAASGLIGPRFGGG
ncbi:MAG: hypothetical protein JWN73_3625 [Betaproteobacteria bacterium]|nr:hypothetical protein [Betaproteobacteria bacterium]